MKDQEARDVLGMLKAATTQYPLDDESVAVWLDSLKPLDAEIATKAVLRGRKTWKKFPAWAEFWEIYAALLHDKEAAEEYEARRTQATIEGKQSFATPEWCWVWTWARCYRDPREGRTFPQQQDFGDPFNRMTMEDYETLRTEWVSAGAPKENPWKKTGERLEAKVVV